MPSSSQRNNHGLCDIMRDSNSKLQIRLKSIFHTLPNPLQYEGYSNNINTKIKNSRSNKR
jgi:hypothetical protein